MAKLNGVEVRDMVNGEITKIAYDGAEYVRAKGKPQKGDIMLETTGDIYGNTKKGSFYEIIKLGSSGSPKYLDDADSLDGISLDYRGEPNLYFRKVAAETPQVSQPFAEMITAKVEAVERRVTALEDAGKASYKTVKRRAKVGERILVTNAILTNGRYQNGDILTVVKLQQYTVVTEESTVWLRHEEYEVIVETPVTLAPADAKPAQEIDYKGATYTLVSRKAQPGDVVVFTENTSCCFTNGKTYGPAILDDGELRVGDDDGDLFDIYTRGFRRTVTNVLVYAPAELPKEQPKPKTGDIVVITANTSGSRNAVGDIGKVGNPNTPIAAEVHVPGKTKGNGNNTFYNDMRLATPAEVAEYHKAVAVRNLKEGDYITIDVLEFSDVITAGKAYKVLESLGGELYFRDDTGGRRYEPISDGAFAVVDEEALPFAKIGRKPNEYRNGDIVRAERMDIGVIYGVIEDVGGEGLYGVRAFKGRYRGIFIDEGSTIELIAPVESRVDRA